MTGVTGSFFGELYLRSTRPFLSPEVTAAEVEYLTRCLAGTSGPILDLGCGHGRHAGPLGAALRPRPVLGVDLDALSLSERSPGFSPIRADLFRLPFADASVGAAYAWYSTLFTFEDARIEAVFVEVARCLRPGGRLIFQTVPLERISADPTASFEGDLPDGCRLVEQSLFDPATGRDESYRRLTTPDGRVLSAHFFIRYYPLPDLTRLMHKAGLSVGWVHGGINGSPLSSSSTDLIVGVDRTDA